MNLFEDTYPGNEAVMEKLLQAIDDNGVVAFTGAGTSMPKMPSWAGLVDMLVKNAAKEGMIDQNTSAVLGAEDSDYLYVVDEVYSAVGKHQTKARVSKIFSELDEPTSAHCLIVDTDFERFMTLNYDQGLEKAFSKQLSLHATSILPKQGNEIENWLTEPKSKERPQILHWHGLASDAESIVLSGSDYNEFYEGGSKNKETLRNIFRNKRLLMIGFGFSDPFIEGALSSIMQLLPRDNSHFAIIGVSPENSLNISLLRRKYSNKYKLEAIFYTVKKSENGSDHSDIEKILNELKFLRPRKLSAKHLNYSPPAFASSGSDLYYESNLFTIGDRKIYCEPNIWLSPNGVVGQSEMKTEIRDIVCGKYHCSIEAPSEYGLTNVGRKLASELAASGGKVVFRNAEDFPKYRKAISADSEMKSISDDDNVIVILDNFSMVDHVRTVRELISNYINCRVIVLSKSNFSGFIDDGLSNLNFKSFQLRGLSRQDIRGVVSLLAPNYNVDVVSGIVDKIYSDLLQLCIPLTPSNVIMYSSVLCRDGNFSPISRLHIVEKFTSEALVRASDAYADTFNSVNKLDLISEFCYGLFLQERPAFTVVEWNNFCIKFKSENLVEFSHSEILSDLINGRIVFRDGQVLQFRYRMFFSYFVGRHISSRPMLLRTCLDQNQHLQLDGLVEVLCGTLHDASEVLDDLTAKLGTAISTFYEKYPISGLDFHNGLRWEFTSKESVLWSEISDKMDRGPVSSKELDVLKSSIQAEQRTLDQKVSIIRFIESETSVSILGRNLLDAVESAKHASARSKLDATKALIERYALVYEVASVFVPLIAEKKYVSWNGFAYINLIEDKGAESSGRDSNRELMRNRVVSALPTSIGRSAADSLGSRKLGKVFLALLEVSSEKTAIKRFFLFCLLVRSKPTDWLSAVKRMVSEVGREDIYLAHMLEISMGQFQREINTEAERQELKQLVASVRLRREANLKSPSAKALNDAVGKMEKSGFWDKLGPDNLGG